MNGWQGCFILLGLAVLPAGCVVRNGGQASSTQKPTLTRTIPDLPWGKRSDWIDVKTDVTPAAKGDGVADDTAALQKALDGVTDGSVLYLPAGSYRITSTLRFEINRKTNDGMPPHRVLGFMFIGHGRGTKLVWDGPEGKEMLLESGATMSRYRGVVFDGRGKASVGLHHKGEEGSFETEVGHRDMAFLNFTDAGILSDTCPATAEVMIENCLFENCRRGIAFLTFNMYDYSIDGCEFRRCATGIRCQKGNTYIRNCHFEGSTDVDLWLNPEHGSSVRRCTSVGSRQFLCYTSGVSPLTIQDCQISGWTQPSPGGAISVENAPVALFDTVFTHPPGKTPPVQIRSAHQRLFVSGNVSASTDGVYTPMTGKVYEIPAGKRMGTLTSADRHFLLDTATVPTVVFDAKRDFGAKGDRKSDDTESIQKAIDAARAYGKGAIAYLPTGFYMVKKPLRVTGEGYSIGGTGYRAALLWGGPKDGNIVEVLDPGDVTMENIAIGNWEPSAQYACDILQTSTGTTPSLVTYDNVSVYGMYCKNPFSKGLCLRGLSKASTVRVRHVEGNIRLIDAARATVLLGNSYEGSLVVEGKSKQRDGFLGVMTRLGTSCPYALYVKDNHSLVASDFYVEQADNAFSLEGSPDDPPGRITLQNPKLHMGKLKDGKENLAFNIRGYHGQINFGPAQFYIEPRRMRLSQTGTLPLEMVLWANSFYNTALLVEKNEAARVWMAGGSGVAAESLDNVQVDEILSPEVLSKLATALDDLRALGELDVRLNHASP